MLVVELSEPVAVAVPVEVAEADEPAVQFAQVAQVATVVGEESVLVVEPVEVVVVAVPVEVERFLVVALQFVELVAARWFALALVAD